MSLPEKIGIESRISLYLPPGPPSGTPPDGLPDFVGMVRATFRIVTAFPEGDWLEVEAVARVFDHEEVEKYKRTPTDPVAEGRRIVGLRATASTSVVDLPLPPLPFARHAVVATIYSHDDGYRKRFDPSNCHLAIVPYGYVSRMRLMDLRDVYAGVGNPTEEEIKRQVRSGAIIAEDEGVHYRTSEKNGKLHLEAVAG